LISYEKSRAAEFGFTETEFCELLAEVASRSLGEAGTAQERARFLETVRLEELLLARACARGHEMAWREFLALYREKLYLAASAIAREESAARELADSLSADLFGMRLGSAGERASKLASYLGRGSLEGWLRTVLAQEYVNRLRQQRKFVAFDEAIACNAKAVSASELQSSPVELETATNAVLSELPPQERFLLASYYLDGRTLAEIARMLNLHESTVSRRLEKTTTNIRKRIVARLRAAGLSKQAAQEMLDGDVRDLGVDVRKHLTQERQS
jgi:RNA polymerase sigma-70 factor (ECF subfamily)